MCEFADALALVAGKFLVNEHVDVAIGIRNVRTTSLRLERHEDGVRLEVIDLVQFLVEGGRRGRGYGVGGSHGDVLVGTLVKRGEGNGPQVLLLVAPALALSGEPDAVSGALALSLGIGLQNIPEGAAISLPLLHNGRTRRQAFGAGAASGLVEPLGALAAFALAGWVQAALPWLMSAAAGCMVCVTAQEMIPEAVEQDEPAGVVSIVLGFALMMALDVAL